MADEAISNLPRTIAELEKDVAIPQVSSVEGEPILVSWEAEVDPANPYNWSAPRKWFSTLLTSFGGLVTLMSGAMLAPALGVIGRDLHISESEAALALSIYVLAFSFGPLFLAPCSEVWGRRPIWVAGCFWYILWNTVCGLSNSRGLLIAGRFMAGLGASAEFAVSAPIVADIWSPDDRGKSITIRGMIPLMGPALGPIVGGVMVQEVNWRWLFYVLSIFDAIIVILFVLFLPETHAPTLLARKANALRKATGGHYNTQYELKKTTIGYKLKLSFVRPFRMLLTQPVIQIMSLVLAYGFGLLYIILSTFSTLWTERYHQSSTASGLHYLSGITGYLIASLSGGWAMDHLWAHLKKKNGGQTKPENRVPLIVPGAMCMPIGLLLYGWGAEKKLHWVVPDIGFAIFGFGYISAGYPAQAYITDAFLDYTASAAAASQLLRNIFAFTFPIFAPSLYNALGYGKANTVLAAIAVICGAPAPFILWRYGEKLRGMGGHIK